MAPADFTDRGEHSLKVILQSLDPALRHGEYVFCTFPGADYGDHADMEPIASCWEREGMTLVVPRAAADAKGFRYGTTYRAVSFGVHSSLDSVGLTAVVTQRLATHGISVNVIAGYYHDHLFVPTQSADDTLRALQELRDSQSG
ncbi:MAG: ACT domain-containing protein [Pseudomonadota bacterium]